MILRLIEPGATEQDTTRRLAARSELLLLDPKETVILDEVIEALQDNGTGSLRWEIENAPAGSTITFDASLQGTIFLTSDALHINQRNS